MCIALGQVRSIPFDIKGNILRHLELVEKASDLDCQAIFFPELSITGYVENFDDENLFRDNDPRLEPFQEVSDKLKMVICVGVPLKTTAGIKISSAIFQPMAKPQMYSKQLLYVDEKKTFIPGDKQSIISIGESLLGLAICYESTQESHLKEVLTMGADHYICMVAKTQAGMLRTSSYYEKMVAKYKIPILLVNGVGPTVEFVNGGGSCIWNKKGRKESTLGSEAEDILIFGS